jgi:hypothetical protein
MKYIHQKMHLTAGDTVIINSTHACKAYLMADWDFDLFKQGGELSFADSSEFLAPAPEFAPVALLSPETNIWHIVILFDADNEIIKYSLTVEPVEAP